MFMPKGAAFCYICREKLRLSSICDNRTEPNLAICDPFVGAIDLIQLINLRPHLDLSFGSIMARDYFLLKDGTGGDPEDQ